MRNRYKRNSYYPKVAEAIGKNYLKLRSLCCVEFDTFHGSLSREDIFQDTVLYVIQPVRIGRGYYKTLLLSLQNDSIPDNSRF